MEIKRIQRAPAAALAAVALLVAGCGSAQRSPSANSTGAAGNGAQAPFRYVACMRNHGVTDFPEPQVSSSNGSTRVAMMVTPAITSSPAFKSAQHACAGILPAPSNLSPAELAAQQRQHARVLLAFAKCLRAHGLSSFPDPDAQGRLTIQMIDAAGVDLHQPGVLTAAKACIGVTHGVITGADVERAISQQP